jgi:hypothetical protein
MSALKEQQNIVVIGIGLSTPLFQARFANMIGTRRWNHRVHNSILPHPSSSV